MKVLVKLWAFLNGNKTIICLTTVAVIQKLIELELLENTKIVQFVVWLFVALASGAFIHHVQKGYLSTEKQ